MKRILCTLTAFFLLFSMAFMTACNANDLQSQLEELNEQIQEKDERIEQLEKALEDLQGKPVGRFYSLQEAYDNGMLTRDDLLSIAYYNHGGRRSNEEIMGEDYSPQPKTPEVLDEEMQRTLRWDYWKYSRDMEHISNMHIYDYYGIYNGYIAVAIDGHSYNFDVIWNQIVDGVCFTYSGIIQITIWTTEK